MKLDFVRSIKQPFAGSNWIFNLLIGAGLGMIAMLASQFGIVGTVVKFIVAGFTVGYTSRVMLNTATSNANSNLPDWTDQPLPTLMQGIVMSFGIAVYMILFTIVGSFIAALFGIAPTASGGIAGAPLVVMALMAIFGLFVVPFIGIMSAHYSVEGRLFAFLEVGQFFRTVRNRPLSILVATLVTFGLMFVSTIVLMPLHVVFASIPMLGAFVYVLLQFAGQLMLANLWAQVYRG